MFCTKDKRVTDFVRNHILVIFKDVQLLTFEEGGATRSVGET